MFERQPKQPYPVSVIFFFALLVILFIAFVIWSKRPANATQEAEEHKNPGLWPAEWFYALREYPDYTTNVATYENALESIFSPTKAYSRNGNKGFSAPWTVEGPANIGARINTIKVDPSNPNNIYIGYSGGGLWKTTDGGASWFPVFDEQPFLSIGDIQLDPQNSNIVYAGTGDPNISGYPFIGDGLWKSTNGGNSWQNIGLQETRIISKVIVHPQNAPTIFVATMGLPFERNDDRGLYKTTNGGQNWEKVLFIGQETGIIDMVMSPNDPNTLYAAAWDRIRNNQESIVFGNNARIWKTTDGGANWTMLEGGLPMEENSRIGLAIDPQNGNHVLATYAGTNLSFNGLYATLDGGVNWAEMPLNVNSNFQSNFAWYFGKIHINPFNNQDIWINGVRTVRSIDGGANWASNVTQMSPGTHVDHHDVAFISENVMLLATDGGLYRSNDGGTNWNKAEYIPTTQFYRVAANPHLPEWYFGGAQDNGTVAGNATGITDWLHLYGGDGFQPAFHPDNPDIIYYEWQDGNIVCSTDGGSFFEDGAQGIDPDDRRNWDMQYMFSRHDPSIMYTGTYRVYKGVGHPSQWAPISPDLTDGNIFGARYHTITTLDESPLDPDLLYVGTTDGNVWQGNPSTSNWENITAGLPERYVSSVKASPTFPDHVFVSHTGYKSNDFQPLLHRSDDLGQTWTAISGDLPQLAINDIIVLPGHQDSVIFVATDGGVYGTINSGQHWERLGSGMPIVPVYDLDFNFAQHTLFAGSHARSILSFPLDSLQLAADVSTQGPLTQKPPHLVLQPTLAQTSITLWIEDLPVKNKTEVWISNLQGKLLWQNEFRGGQRGHVPLSVDSWPPGIYVAFARTAGRVWAQQKFVVTR